MIERDELRELLYGSQSHLHIVHALEGLDPKVAGAHVEGSPHTIFQVLHHMVYWTDLALERMQGDEPADPESAAEGWDAPYEPEDESDWEAAVASLAEARRGLEELIVDESYDRDRVVRRRVGTSARREVLMVQAHNSYHLGQIVQLRQQLGCWPPPRGGDTW